MADMPIDEINEHDVVRLKDGREGTIVFIGKAGFLVELTDEYGRTIDLIDVSLEDIDAVTWKVPRPENNS